jgi:hypothetical protein
MYKIIAKSIYGTEVIDSTDSILDAEHLVNEYRLAYGPTFTIYYKKQ